MDKLTVLETLERLASKLRAVGLYPVTRLGRYITNRDLVHQMGLANLQVARQYLEGKDKALEQVRQAVLKLVEK